VSENVTKEQLTGVLYGVYTDFETSYEQHQGHRPDFLSSFTPEDLPSDHVGFWAAINGKSLDEIPDVLERLGEVSRVPFTSRLAENHEFSPMIVKQLQHGRSYEIQTTHIPWPSWLVIDLIPSGPETWQRME
jgi:hypothetical protein